MTNFILCRCEARVGVRTSRPGSLSRSLLLLLFTLSCLTFGSALGQEPTRVLGTIGMVADVAANVAAECATVEFLMGSGVDPHLYRASASDIARLNDAELILYAGLFLEGQLGDVLENFSRRKPTVAVAERAVSEEQLILTDDGYGVDPHVWMDVSLWAQTVPVITQAVGELQPQCSEALQERAQAYRTEMLALHDWITRAVASIPEGQRILVTAHDAFSYYGRAYGIEVVGIQGISTDAEAGIADIRRTVDVVVERSVPAIFVESTISPRTIQAVVEAAEDRGHSVTIGDPLYSDAMGSEGTRGGTYLGMLYENTVSIVTGLGGELPPLPAELEAWQGRWQ